MRLFTGAYKKIGGQRPFESANALFELETSVRSDRALFLYMPSAHRNTYLLWRDGRLEYENPEIPLPMPALLMFLFAHYGSIIPNGFWAPSGWVKEWDKDWDHTIHVVAVVEDEDA